MMKWEGVNITAVLWDWWKGCTSDWEAKERERPEHDELRFWLGDVWKTNPTGISGKALELHGQEPGVWKQSGFMVES